MATAHSSQVAASDVPKAIKFDAIVVDVACHPERDMIATGDIDGQVAVYSYGPSENHQLMTFEHHKKACRALQFNSDGTKLVTVSKDKSIQVVDMDSGTVTRAIKKAHESAIYSLLIVDDNIIATGDDDGHLKVWDLRHQAAIMDVHENEEFISDMIIDSSKRTLVATCGEGTLTAFDIRKHKMKVQSELMDSALLSIAVVKNGSKVVCGSEEGILNIFNWDEWGNISDRFPGHPISVETIVPVTDSVVCTGAFDGIIRAVSILPNRFLGVVGDHDDFPVENMSQTRCGRYLVSCAHDQKVKFWDLDEVKKEKVDTSRRAKKTNTPKPLSSGAQRDDFFSDLAAEPSAAENPEKLESTQKSRKNVKGNKNKNDSSSDSSDDDDSDDDEKDNEDSNEDAGAEGVEKGKVAQEKDRAESDKDLDNSDSDSDAKSDNVSSESESES